MLPTRCRPLQLIEGRQGTALRIVQIQIFRGIVTAPTTPPGTLNVPHRINSGAFYHTSRTLLCAHPDTPLIRLSLFRLYVHLIRGHPGLSDAVTREHILLPTVPTTLREYIRLFYPRSRSTSYSLGVGWHCSKAQSDLSLKPV